MHPAPASPLGQVIAAIIDLLIAALTEHAAEHPLLAPGCRASIRRLEKISHKLQAMVAEWEATQTQTPNRKKGVSPPPHRPPPARQGAPAPSPRPAIAAWHPARGPPQRCSPANRSLWSHARAPPTHA